MNAGSVYLFLCATVIGAAGIGALLGGAPGALAAIMFGLVLVLMWIAVAVECLDRYELVSVKKRLRA